MAYLKRLSITGVALAWLASAGLAQGPAGSFPKRVSPDDGLSKQLVPKGATPRLPNGKPDLTGIWGGGSADSPYPRGGARGQVYFEPDQATMQRGNAWSKPLYRPEFWDKVAALDYGKVTDDPSFHCLPPGVPRINAPEKIVQTDKQLMTINTGYVYTTRAIPTDGRKRDDGDSDYEFYNGFSLGHWEGDTLVVETTGFNNITWLAWTGYLHSNRMTTTERFTRVGDVLYYSFTVDDPGTLLEPWQSATYIRRLNPDPLARLDDPFPCVEQDLNNIQDLYYRG